MPHAGTHCVRLLDCGLGKGTSGDFFCPAIELAGFEGNVQIDLFVHWDISLNVPLLDLPTELVNLIESGGCHPSAKNIEKTARARGGERDSERERETEREREREPERDTIHLQPRTTPSNISK